MLRERNDVLRVPTNSWIPSMVQTDSLCKNIVFHVSHILLKYIEFLKPASASFPTYISHPYMEKTKEKSIFLNCDLIEASENSSQGIIKNEKKLNVLEFFLCAYTCFNMTVREHFLKLDLHTL